MYILFNNDTIFMKFHTMKKRSNFKIALNTYLKLLLKGWYAKHMYDINLKYSHKI